MNRFGVLIALIGYWSFTAGIVIAPKFFDRPQSDRPLRPKQEQRPNLQPRPLSKTEPSTPRAEPKPISRIPAAAGTEESSTEAGNGLIASHLNRGDVEAQSKEILNILILSLRSQERKLASIAEVGNRQIAAVDFQRAEIVKTLDRQKEDLVQSLDQQRNEYVSSMQEQRADIVNTLRANAKLNILEEFIKGWFAHLGELSFLGLGFLFSSYRSEVLSCLHWPVKTGRLLFALRRSKGARKN